jgi:hypothetical protein
VRGKVQREGEREWERLRARERGERCWWEAALAGWVPSVKTSEREHREGRKRTRREGGGRLPW